MTDLDAVEAVAVAAAQAGGAELRRRYRDGDRAGDYRETDVKAAADEAAESRMLPVVRQAFPDHEVFAEESGEFAGTEPYRWILDPLDGTNNFTAGLPTFATSVAVLEAGEPALAVVHQPATDETYVARRGEGVRYGGEPVAADSDLAPATATVAFVVGREVPTDPDRSAAAEALKAALRDRVKRVIPSWAPTVHSGLFARGAIEGVVQLFPDEEEADVTDLLAAEAGGATETDGPLTLSATDEATLDELRAAVAEVEGEFPWT